MSCQTQKLRVLRRLQQSPCTSWEFAADMGILRYGARIWELVQEGHDIRCETKIVGGKHHVTWYLKGQLSLPLGEVA
jgi:hypothetical protein